MLPCPYVGACSNSKAPPCGTGAAAADPVQACVNNGADSGPEFKLLITNTDAFSTLCQPDACVPNP